MPPETTETAAKKSTVDQRISIFDYLNDTEAGEKKRVIGSLNVFK